RRPASSAAPAGAGPGRSRRARPRPTPRSRVVSCFLLARGAEYSRLSDALRSLLPGPAMLIDAIDVYWVRIPLAFVWKTSYADQHYTDTILVRMEAGGRHAWGESCPPYIPAYSAEHTLATFHTIREHMAGRIVGQDIPSAADLLDRLGFVKGNQFARAALEITW